MVVIDTVPGGSLRGAITLAFLTDGRQPKLSHIAVR